MKPSRSQDFLNVSGFSPEDKETPENRKLAKEFSHGNLVREIFTNEVEMKEYFRFYKMLCDYAHPTMKGVLWEENFSEQNSKDNLLLILEFAGRTIDSFFNQKLFTDLIRKDLRYASILGEFMDEVSEYLEAKRDGSK